MKRPAAVLVSDIHFSDKPPIARSAEPDWFDAQERQWSQVWDAGVAMQVPIVIAGDIFDAWRSSPATINFAIRIMQDFPYGIYAIPGQHDLPNHSYDEIKRSAYWTLVEAGVVYNLGHECVCTDDSSLVMQGVPWGFEIPAGPRADSRSADPAVYLAVIHRYCWIKGQSFVDAGKDSHLSAIGRMLIGYDAAVFGDNHKGFVTSTKVGCNVLNCGGFMARKSDERGYGPRYGVLYDDGSILAVPFDISCDAWIDPSSPDYPEIISKSLNITEVMQELQTLGKDGLDFVELLLYHLDDIQVGAGVRKVITLALDEGREHAST